MTSRGWLGSARGRGMVLVSLLCVFALAFAVACGGGNDDAAPANTTAVATVTTSSEVSPTATEAAQTSAIATAVATEAEAAPSPAATETEVEVKPTEDQPDPTPTEAEADASPTAGTTGGDEDPLADLKPIDPEALPNFTMSFTFDLTGIPAQEDTSISVEAEQSSLENYHMSLSTTGTNLETWLVDGTNYVDQGDGTIVALPEGTDSVLFSPALFLQEVPPIEPELQAERVGEEEVSGRRTIRYVIAGKNYLEQAGQGGEFTGGGPASDVEGQVEVWIDIELNMMIKQLGDITWTNEDGTIGTFLSDMLMFDIGSTEAVEAPQ